MAINTATTPELRTDVSPQPLAEAINASIPNSQNFATRLTKTVDGLCIADFTVTSAQLLAAFATPVTLIAAPGAGLTNVVEKVFISYIAGGTAYTVGGAGAYYLKYTSASGVSVAAFPATGIVDQTGNIVAVANSLPAPAAGIVVTANAAVVFGQLTAPCTLGTGTLNLRVFYSVIPSVF